MNGSGRKTQKTLDIDYLLDRMAPGDWTSLLSPSLSLSLTQDVNTPPSKLQVAVE